MDAMQFDQLARSLSAGTRRGMLAFVATLPILSGLAAFLAMDEEADAKGRRKRRKKRHKHRKGRRKRKRKGKKTRTCKAKSRAKICAGKCGIVKNKKSCKKRVDCGPCACEPPCPVCTTCQSDGRCSAPCEGKGCCDGTSCQPGDSQDACGKNGGACAACSGNDTCDAGSCGCAPITTCPAPFDCGEINDDCGGTLDCGSCGNPTPICVSNVCTACSTEHPCPSGQICDVGACQACDVCAGDCDFTTVQAAITAASAGDIIRICPGTYEPITIGTNLTLIGAGEGSDPAVDTILDAAGNGRVVDISDGVTADLRALRITGGNTTHGAGVRNKGTLTMTACTVHKNVATIFGGGLVNIEFGTMTLTNCTVSKNTAEDYSGGIDQTSPGTLTLNHTTVSGNSASTQNGGGISVDGSEAHFTDDSAITGNIAAVAGGGLYVVGLSTVSFDSSCSVTGNTAANGGGIYSLSPNVTLNGAAVKNNEPNDCVGLTC